MCRLWLFLRLIGGRLFHRRLLGGVWRLLRYGGSGLLTRFGRSGGGGGLLLIELIG